MSSFNHQDWDPVVLKNKMNDVSNRTLRKKGKIPTQTSKSEAQERLGKVARTEVGSVPKTSLEMCRLVQKTRLARKLTQKQLAQMANVRPDEISKLETANKPVNMGVVAKVERQLKIQIRGMIRRD